MQSSVIGGAMLPHAPQFFTMPETEDPVPVEQVRKVAKEIGVRLKALKPDLWIIFANDHAEQFFHNVCPAFTVHVGGEARGHFAGREIEDKRPLERYRAESQRLLEVLEKRLEGRQWIMGEAYTIADISMLGWVRNLIGFYGARELVDYDSLKLVPAWLERALARPAVKRGLEIPKRP